MERKEIRRNPAKVIHAYELLSLEHRLETRKIIVPDEITRETNEVISHTRQFQRLRRTLEAYKPAAFQERAAGGLLRWLKTRWFLPAQPETGE